MAQFLFVFGYESPDEWRNNQALGTDFESSDAVWVESESEEAALKAGRDYAQRRVAELFSSDPLPDWLGWSQSGYACWIEQEPSQKWAALRLKSIPCVKG